MFDTPFNIAGYTEKLIRDQQARGLNEVVSNDPSVRSFFSEGSAYGDNYFIRGFPVLNTDITFDGLYGVVDGRRPALQNVERVEVLKGPSALLNGVSPFGAVGGMINLVPKRATDEPLTRITPMFISQGQGGVAVDLGRRFGAANEWGVRLNGLYRNGQTAIDKERLEVGFGSIGLDYRGERVRFSFDLSHQTYDGDRTRNFIGILPGVPVPKAPRLTRNLSQPFEFGRTRQLAGATRLEVDVTDRITVFAAAGGSAFKESALAGFQQIINSAGTIAGPYTRQAYDTDSFSGEAGIRARFETGFLSHDVTVSAAAFQTELSLPKLTQYFFSGVSSIYSPILLPRPLVADMPLGATLSRQTNRGVTFADTISAFGDRVQFTVGGRYQEIASKNYQAVPGTPDFGLPTARYDQVAWSPAVALAVKPIDRLTVYGNYVEGLVSAGTAPAVARNAHQALPAIVADQKEVGVKYDFGPFGASLALFEINKANAALNPTTLVYGIDGLQRNRGLEVNVFGEPFEGIRLLGGVALTEARQVGTSNAFFNGRTAPGVPETTVNLYGEYDLPRWMLRGLTATGRVVYTSSQYFDQANTQKIPDWTRVDAGLRYTFTGSWGKPVTLRANVENVFGAKYWSSAAQGLLGLARPRTYVLSAQLDF